MGKKYLFFLLSLVFIISGCKTSSNVTSVEETTEGFVLNENFESYNLGEINISGQIDSYVGMAAYMSSHIASEGCIEGNKCLKTKNTAGSFGPDYTSVYYFEFESVNPYKTIFIQFYFKYLYSDTMFRFSANLPGNLVFDISRSSGAEISSMGHFQSVVEPNRFVENSWYRVELMLEYGEELYQNIRIYEGNETIPMSGSTLIDNIRTFDWGVNEDNMYPGTFYAYAGSITDGLVNSADPENDLEPYAWYFDDFRIGYDENETLLVGF